MKKIFLTGTLALAASLGGLTVSCGDFLDITPLNAVVVQNYWEKKSEVESVITSCYYHMQDAGFAQRVIAWGEVRGDNLTSSSTMEADNKEMYDFYINNITADNSWTSWADFYNVINLCNTILHYAPEAQVKDGNYSMEELHTHEAEAKAIRALCYFYLVRSFKKLPLVTQATIDDDETFQVAASSADEVLDQIVEDLEWAKNYIWDRKFFDTSAERKGRFNKQSVKALLADIYLWRGDYARCAQYCKEIMDEKMADYETVQKEIAAGNYTTAVSEGYLALYRGYPLLDDSYSAHYAYLMNFSYENSFESIFELQYDYENREKGNEGILNLYGKHDEISGLLLSASYLASQSSGALFADANDVRLFENTSYNGTSSNSYPVCKYRMQIVETNSGIIQTTRATAENWIVYRLTDIMLMRAEALAYMNDEEGHEEAFELVAAVNARACGGRTTLVYDAGQIKTLVLEERQRELMFEGKRWYDLMRMVLHSENPTATMGTLRSTYLLRKYQSGGRDAVARIGSLDNLYLPINQADIDVNPLLEPDQNPAYIIY